MPKKTTRQTKPSAEEPKLDPMAEVERRIGESHQTDANEFKFILH